MTDHKALSFDTLTRLAIEAELMGRGDTMSNLPAEYAGSICIFAELVAAEVRAKDGAAQAPAVPAVPNSAAIAKRRASYLRQNTDAGRAYVAQFFKAAHCHVFDDYIHTALAGDFACELASILAAPQSEAQAPAVPAWNGELSDSLRKALSALYAECPADMVRDVSFKVRQECEAIYTSYTTVKHMYRAAREKLEAIEAAQPQPEAQAVPAVPTVVTEAMHVAAVKVLHRATGLDGLPQRMLDAMLAAAPQPEAAMEADMFWDANDGERFGHDIQDIIAEYGPGDRVKIDCAKRLPSIEVLVVAEGDDDFTYQIIDAALAAQGDKP